MNTVRLRKGVCSLDNNNVNNTSANNNSCHMPPYGIEGKKESEAIMHMDCMSHKAL